MTNDGIILVERHPITGHHAEWPIGSQPARKRGQHFTLFGSHAQHLPRLSLIDGVPEEHRAMVVIPAMLTTSWAWRLTKKNYFRLSAF